jgi:hypothetical protein
MNFISLLSVTHANYGIQANGYQWFVDTHIQKELCWGVKRFFLHLPFFPPLPNPTTTYEFDQVLAATPQLRAEFTRSISTLTRPSRGEPVEVIAYVGGLRWKGDPSVATDYAGFSDFEDPSMAALVRAHKGRGDWGAFRNRVEQNIRPLIDAGCSIGIDTSAQC